MILVFMVAFEKILLLLTAFCKVRRCLYFYRKWYKLYRENCWGFYTNHKWFSYWLHKFHFECQYIYAKSYLHSYQKQNHENFPYIMTKPNKLQNFFLPSKFFCLWHTTLCILLHNRILAKWASFVGISLEQ